MKIEALTRVFLAAEDGQIEEAEAMLVSVSPEDVEEAVDAFISKLTDEQALSLLAVLEEVEREPLDLDALRRLLGDDDPDGWDLMEEPVIL